MVRPFLSRQNKKTHLEIQIIFNCRETFYCTTTRPSNIVIVSPLTSTCVRRSSCVIVAPIQQQHEKKETPKNQQTFSDYSRGRKKSGKNYRLSEPHYPRQKSISMKEARCDYNLKIDFYVIQFKNTTTVSATSKKYLQLPYHVTKWNYSHKT